MQMILKLCSMQFFATDEYLNGIFGFRQTSAFGQIELESGENISRFEDAGYENSIFILLLGPIFFLILAFVAFVILKLLLQKATNRCSENFLTRKLRIDLPYMVIMTRFFLESCIEIGLSAMICVLSIDSATFTTFSEALSTIFAIISLILLLLAPFYLFNVAKRFMNYVYIDMEVKQE